MTQTAYCDQDGLEDRLSAAGVTYRTDDTPPDSLGDVINDASSQIEGFCPNYAPANLATSEWVKHRALDIAAWLLCARRGDPPPPGVQLRYDRAIKDLERVQLGSIRIPGCPQVAAAAPTLSNHRVVLNPYPRVVTERHKSTAAGTGYVPVDDPLDPIDWVI